MGFEDLFDNKRKYHGNYTDQKYHDENRYSHDTDYSNNEKDNQFKWSTYLEKVKSNKKLKRLVILAGVLILGLVIALIIVLLPVIIKLINYISQNGLQGIMDSITGFLDKILKGSAQ
jgi:hypothetical protein